MAGGEAAAPMAKIHQLETSMATMLEMMQQLAHGQQVLEAKLDAKLQASELES